MLHCSRASDPLCRVLCLSAIFPEKGTRCFPVPRLKAGDCSGFRFPHGLPPGLPHPTVPLIADCPPALSFPWCAVPRQRFPASNTGRCNFPVPPGMQFPWQDRETPEPRYLRGLWGYSMVLSTIGIASHPSCWAALPQSRFHSGYPRRDAARFCSGRGYLPRNNSECRRGPSAR